ncbi:3-hydroxyisobutyrate dehydrogenase [Auritidibacter sp. NML100628]|uniref:3-hydroxyisobutyrate dehydrogenase n=1 Tax=Auritidibacter sp. NML100628 TaxID=2170742 RepID=UPI000D72FE3D|nr:3-hydroxyisobutyrate dehydrogenase [Auritidibacter sp. NML100628]PXA77295.1 3-hydroxyisobutyrate dehydrogenase [Auritidibacter sp. NML100628]
MNIAFLGLGNMGAHMARNLLEAGYQVTGFDVVPAAVERAAEAGIAPAESGEAAVRDAEVVITMFQNGQQVLDAYQGLLAAAPENTLFIDSSTISVDEARQAAEQARQAGHRPLDAPVSGGMSGAEAGTLTFMVGGDAEAFATAEPLFQAMGRKIVHCGNSGAGQAAKVCNNMLLAVTTIGASEAFALGQNLGLSDQALYDVLSTSAAQCWTVTTNCPVPGPVGTAPADRGYAPGFATALMAKDLGLAHAAIETTGTSASFGEAAYEAYRQFNELDGGAYSGQDFSAIIKTIRQS